MRHVLPDLYETRTDNPFPGLTTHAYLWTGGDDGNVLFYSAATVADFDAIAELGGCTHQYLSHRDEAGPMLHRIAKRFGAKLHAPAVESGEIGPHAQIDVPLADRHVDDNSIEVIPTPGHSPGSTCYLVPGADGRTYLFTGDTLILGDDGRWFAGYLPSISDADALTQSLRLLAILRPDVVISSAFTGEHGVTEIAGRTWADCVDEALTGLAHSVS
jgi:hydroxyacylglutathione hydrolase